jgi:hypothetical protein
MPTLGINANKIPGTNLSKDPHILPSNGTGGKLIRNVGCSKNIRKTLVSAKFGAVKHTIDALQCKGMASTDNDCGEEVFTNGIYCACVLTGKTCDMVQVPGATMFIPTTTLPPNHLNHGKEIFSCDPKKAVPPPVTVCNSSIGGAFITLPKGDIDGPPSFVGYATTLHDCKQKCCGLKVCEAIKFSNIDKMMEVPAILGKPDNCAMYGNISKYNATMSQDRDYVVHAIKRTPQANETLNAEQLEKQEMLEAMFARKAADEEKKKKDAVEKESDELEADAKAKEDRANGVQQTGNSSKAGQQKAAQSS